MWALHVAYRRAGQVGEGWVVIGSAENKPLVTWGPFVDEAAAEAYRAGLVAMYGAAG